MVTITIAQVTLILGVLSIISIILGVVFWIQRPQVALEKRVAQLEDGQKTNNKDIEVIKTTHSENNGAMQKEMKELTTAINSLNVTVGKLETKIDERIPKGSPTLTPVGT